MDLDPLAKQDPGESPHPLVSMLIAHVNERSLQSILDGLVAALNGSIGSWMVRRSEADFDIKSVLQLRKDNFHIFGSTTYPL